MLAVKFKSKAHWLFITKLYKVAMFLLLGSKLATRRKDSTVSRRHVSSVVQCPHWISNSLCSKNVFVRAHFKDGGLEVIFRLLWLLDPGAYCTLLFGHFHFHNSCMNRDWNKLVHSYSSDILFVSDHPHLCKTFHLRHDLWTGFLVGVMSKVLQPYKLVNKAR